MVYKGVRSYLSTSWSILREEPEVRRWLLANAFWEGTFAAARTFVVLYITQGLREDAGVATGVFACVAAGYVVAAVFAGRIGYQALWPLCAVPIILSIPLVAGLIRVETPSGRPEPQPG